MVLDGILKGTVCLDNFDIYPDAFLFAMPFCIYYVIFK